MQIDVRVRKGRRSHQNLFCLMTAGTKPARCVLSLCVRARAQVFEWVGVPACSVRMYVLGFAFDELTDSKRKKKYSVYYLGTGWRVQFTYTGTCINLKRSLLGVLPLKSSCLGSFEIKQNTKKTTHLLPLNLFCAWQVYWKEKIKNPIYSQQVALKLSRPAELVSCLTRGRERVLRRWRASGCHVTAICTVLSTTFN